MPMANTKWVDSRTVDGRISNIFTISSPPPCQNQQNHHHCQCSILHPPRPPKYPIQNLHLRCGVENDLSKGSPSSKFTGSSTSSLRSKLANANNTSVQTRIIRMHIPHLFLIGKYYFLRVPTGLFVPWCQTHHSYLDVKHIRTHVGHVFGTRSVFPTQHLCPKPCHQETHPTFYLIGKNPFLRVPMGIFHTLESDMSTAHVWHVSF